MYYVGLDVHSSSSSLEILDDDGKTFKRLDGINCRTSAGRLDCQKSQR